MDSYAFANKLICACKPEFTILAAELQCYDFQMFASRNMTNLHGNIKYRSSKLQQIPVAPHRI